MATFGKTDVGGSNATSSSSYVWLSIAVLSETAYISSISMYHAFAGYRYFRYGIYSESGGTFTLLRQTEEGYTNTNGDWDTLNLESVLELSAGTYYLGFQFSTGAANEMKYDAYTNGEYYKLDSYAQGNSLPSSISSMIGRSRQYSIYATYSTTPSGPTGVKTINGVAIASVKTVNDTSIGNVKNINGLTT